jgi:MoaE-MoaD fusion protein
MMHAVRILLFARFRDTFSAEAIEMAVPGCVTVREIREHVAFLKPGLANLLARSVIAVNGEPAADDAVVDRDDEIALLPPVSGG